MGEVNDCPICGKPYLVHVYPEKAPCPKCGSLKAVAGWEAWGHPNGELYCRDCTRPQRVRRPYWTFHMENGEPVIREWHEKSPQAESEGAEQ